MIIKWPTILQILLDIIIIPKKIKPASTPYPENPTPHPLIPFLKKEKDNHNNNIIMKKAQIKVKELMNLKVINK